MLSRQRILLGSLLGGLLFACTCVDGATHHLAAFLLRCVIAVVCVRLWPVTSQKIPIHDLLAPVFVTLVLLGYAPFSPNGGPGVQILVRVVLAVTIFVTFRMAHNRYSLTAITLSSCIACAHSIWSIAEWGILEEKRGTGGFFSPNDLAAFLAPLFVWNLSQVLSREEYPTSDNQDHAHTQSCDKQLRDNPKVFFKARLPKYLQVFGHFLVSQKFLVFVLGVGLLSTGSRSGLLAAAVACAVLAVFRMHRHTILILILLTISAFAIPSVRMRMLGDRDAFPFARVQIWKTSIALSLENPLGVGLAGAPEALRTEGVPVPGPVRYPRRAHHAHSELLQAWLELGLPGLLAALSGPIALILLFWRRKNSSAKREKKPLLMSPTNFGFSTNTQDPPARILAMLAAFSIPALVSLSLHLDAVAFLAAVWAAHEFSQVPLNHQDRYAVVGTTRARRLVAIFLSGFLVLSLLNVISQAAIHRAKHFREMGRLDLAEDLASVGVNVAPWSVSAQLMFESLRYANGAPVVDVLEQLLVLSKLHPTFPQPLDRAATVLEQQATTKQSAEVWALAADIRAQQVKRDPTNVLIWLKMGRAQLRAGQLQHAHQTFLRAVDIEKNCAAAWIHLAAIHASQEKMDLAAQNISKAKKANNMARYHKGPSKTILSIDQESEHILKTLGAMHGLR